MNFYERIILIGVIGIIGYMLVLVIPIIVNWVSDFTRVQNITTNLSGIGNELLRLYKFIIFSNWLALDNNNIIITVLYMNENDITFSELLQYIIDNVPFSD